MIWCIFALNLTTGGNNFNDFHENQLTKFCGFYATQNSRLQVPKVAIAVLLHISCRLQAMATLGMIYPARGGLAWGQMRGWYLKSVGSTPPGGSA